MEQHYSTCWVNSVHLQMAVHKLYQGLSSIAFKDENQITRVPELRALQMIVILSDSVGGCHQRPSQSCPVTIMKILHNPTIMKLMLCASLTAFVGNCVLLVYQYQVINKFVSKNVYLNDSGLLFASCQYSVLMATMEEDNPHLNRLPVDFEEVAITVEPNNRFSLIDDKAWAATLAPKRGFIRLGPEGRAFAVSLFHQLHCVNAIRFSYTVARDGLVTDPEILSHKIGHDNHCFQFLRQSILCKADTSLVPVPTNRNVSLASMGFGSTHRCRDWGRVRQFVFDNVAEWESVPLFNQTSGRHIGSNSRL
jgi:hypothetical protein